VLTDRRPNSSRLWLAILLFLALGIGLAPKIASAKKPLPDHPVDLNAATAKELEELPGIGPTTAAAIINFRTKSGRIRRVEDLLAIRGISESKLKKIRPYVTLGAPPPSAPPAKKITVTPKPATASPAHAIANH
jgi:competence ComEA-like helix-hairpin-helix protein